jgi:hypothetical protein
VSIDGNPTPFDEAQGRLRDGPRRRDLLRVNGNCLLKNNKTTARPEEPPSSGGVSKPVLSIVEGGARRRRSTVSKGEKTG